LHLRQSRNLPVSSHQLERYKSEGNIDDSPLLTPTEIESCKRAASQSLRKLQAQHQQLQEGCLESLAEAIVFQPSPHLDQPSMVFVQEERVDEQLKQLISREKRQKMYRKLGHLLNKLGGKGLRRIGIPDEAAFSATSGVPHDPKSWWGPWQSVTNPTEIAKKVCKVNAAQYNQAHHAPF
jgi:hypothetical protein